MTDLACVTKRMLCHARQDLHGLSYLEFETSAKADFFQLQFFQATAKLEEKLFSNLFVTSRLRIVLKP